MTTLFKTVLCPRCNEDYLLITQYADTKELYLSCSECEASWRRPEDINDSSKMFVDPDIDASATSTMSTPASAARRMDPALIPLVS